MKYFKSLLIILSYLIYNTILAVLLELIFTWASGFNNFLFILISFLINGLFLGLLYITSSILYGLTQIHFPFKKNHSYVFNFFSSLFFILMMYSIWSINGSIFKNLVFSSILIVVTAINFNVFQKIKEQIEK